MQSKKLFSLFAEYDSAVCRCRICTLFGGEHSQLSAVLVCWELHPALQKSSTQLAHVSYRGPFPMDDSSSALAFLVPLRKEEIYIPLGK
jgi:hypothetical protein